jgi:capsular polysaccharide transport system ATP-binding protein
VVVLENVTKHYGMRDAHKTVLRNLSATFATGQSLALLGRNGSGKSTLLKLLAGTIRPSEGRVRASCSVSYPVGFAGSFHPDLTGVQNTRFVARLYGVDSDALVDFVRDFAELGGHFTMPLRSYSAGMKSRLSFGVSMGIRFDLYLVDEVTSVGDGAFRRRSVALLEERLTAAGAIVVTHSPAMARRLCTAGAVLEGGRLTFYEDVEEALAVHERNLTLPPS